VDMKVKHGKERKPVCLARCLRHNKVKEDRASNEEEGNGPI